jgi:hypothetical protein
MIAVVMLASVALASGAPSPPFFCASGDKKVFARVADLPAGVQSIIQQMGGMANPNENYQSTDVISGPPLPIKRMLSAAQSNCQIEISYQRAVTGQVDNGKLLVQFVDEKWIVLPNSDYPFSQIALKTDSTEADKAGREACEAQNLYVVTKPDGTKTIAPALTHGAEYVWQAGQCRVVGGLMAPRH